MPYLHRNKILILIGILMLCLKIFLANEDGFLHEWDERYHALVAKNMMQHPAKPMLRLDPVLAYDHRDWCCNHIWLHKPPLALWSIAASMKVFGLSVLALRLPGMLLSTLLILIAYSAGRTIGTSELGFLGGIFAGISYYHIELSLGAVRLDHVDNFLLFFTSLAMLSSLRLLSKPSPKWVWIAGLATGAAVLSKWLIGFAPLGIYFATLLLSNSLRNSRKHWLDAARC